MRRVFTIAEAGSCHDGSLDKAIHLVHLAQDIGADAVKLQYWSDADRLADRRRAPNHYREIYRRYQMPRAWLNELYPVCLAAGIEFMATVYLPEDIEVIAPYVSRFKVASFEAGDLAFVRAHAPYGKPVIISTGMMERRPTHTHGDMETWWLQCISAYPTPLNEASLGVLRRGEFDGYSDHTACVYTGAFAVCAGATILEFHVSDWATSPDNPDVAAALDPAHAKEYVRLVRLAERMLGDGIKKPMPAEAAMMPYRVQP